jgi:cytochrome c oxidase assembly protein subunit 15
MNSGLHRLAAVAAIIAFCVIVLGAYVRLSHAGLGCPDWPGCYGKLTWPVEAHEVSSANLAFPERPVETHKAWKEMVHRYLAGTLVLLVLAINVLAWRGGNQSIRFRYLAGLLLVVILFQAALGMWTVTLKLKPIVVMGHLMGGIATFGLLLWLAFPGGRRDSAAARHTMQKMRPLITVAALVLVVQFMLGGWTSANYSALACPDFPTCQGEWWPESNFSEGFVLWREIGVDYEGGVLDLQSRVAIQLAHRIGALVTFLVIGTLSVMLIRQGATRGPGILLAALLLTQVTLGILNIVLYLPLPNAVAHNAVGALLAAMMIWLLYRSRPGRT